jgi:signal transduction histidine kinase/ligand-binding sensor domain-containing protein/CheY-like chemotaxis protein/HPt (histidine-containing phosphotransfer) domain-containing protein
MRQIVHRDRVNRYVNAVFRRTRAATLMLGLLGAPVALWAADAPGLVLESLGAAEGLPQATVNATLQDTQGFVWLGTEDGLVRYDGHELVRYAYSRTVGGGMPGNFIRDIVEDSDHDLWIAVKDAGLARWNRATDSFTVYRHDAAKPGSLASDVTRVVRVDRRGRIWIGMSDAGIDVLDPQSGAIEHLRHDPKNPGSLGDDRIFTMTLDRTGALWIGTAAGLDRWQPERHAFTHFRPDANDPSSFDGTLVSQIFEDQSGSLWVGSFEGGMSRLDHDGHRIERFQHDGRRATSLVSDDVRAILEDHAGHLWVGTPEGLDLLDRASGRFTHYRHDEHDPGSLRDSFVMSLYEDATGLVWIGTRAGGVARWNPRSWELGGNRPHWLDGKIVTSFADAGTQKLWIASMGGLSRFDPANGDSADIDGIVGRRDALGDKRVMSLRQDHRGTLWIGTMTSGLKKLTADGRLESIPIKIGDAHSVSAAGIMTIFESHNGLIWLGTLDGGANVLDPLTQRVRQLPYKSSAPGAISAGSVTAIAEDLQGNMWFGTDSGGLDLARADGTVVKTFRHDPNDPASIPSNTIYAIEVDAKGRIWVGTDGGGLARVVGSAASPETIGFETVTREQGLSSDTIYGVLSDSKGRIWLSGDAGLMRVDPDTGAVKTYHREYGLQGEEFDYNAAFRSADGRLCFGGSGGFNIFDPARLTENTHAPRLALTRIEVLGVPVPSAKAYWLLDRIPLDYRASIVSLDFGALDFTSPTHNRLAYRVAGLSDRWIDLGTQRRVTLTNLDAGDHSLEVRAANADSVWSNSPLRITIHRDPAPWRSPWAYAVYALIAVLFLVYRNRLQRANIERMLEAKRRLESEVALRTRELVDSNLQLADAAQAKSNFLARISHELRTPLNGVVGMTELLERTPLSSTQARLTQTVRSSAQLLIHVVNDLLDLSKLQAGRVEFEALPLDLLSIIEECTTLFAAAAEAKGVELIVSPPLHEVSALIGDPLRVRQILMNLVGNAIKFTMQGTVAVMAEIGQTVAGRTTVRIAVADTGVGIEAATIERIFEPFTQADESTTRRFGGTGLGLAICRELAERMGGTVRVESRPNAGSTFRLELPMQVAGPAAPREVSRLARRRARILTGQAALAESLARYASLLDLDLAAGPAPSADVSTTAPEILIADLATHAASVLSILDAPVRARPPLVILGTTGQIEALQRVATVDPEVIVHKPAHREILLQALRAAAGLGRVSALEAPHLVRDLQRGGGHVLLVEDEPVNAAVAQGYLAELGCTCEWVQNGPDAAFLCAGERFDLIMMDLNMPTMDGFATSRLIREGDGQGRRIPIIALTAHNADDYRDACRDAGMNDILSKPFSMQQCADLLARWMPAARQPLSPSPPCAATGIAAPVIEAAADDAALTDIDPAAVARLQSLRRSGSANLYSEIVDLFRSSSTAAIAELESALQCDDLAAARAVCHKLAASTANVGALAFARDARLLERLCATGDRVRALPLSERLIATHPALIEELMRFQQRAIA